VSTVEERAAFLEGRVGEDSQMMDGIRDSIAGLEGRFTALEQRCGAIEAKLDRRCDAIEDKLDRRFETLDQKLDRHVERLDMKMSRQFAWIVGVQITVLLSVVAALVTR
jgi:hypothetical protein